MTGKRVFDKGTKVNVVSNDGDVLGVGTLLTDYDVDAEHNVTPRIRLKDGKVLTGDECLWTPKLSGDKLRLVGKA